MRVVAAEPGRGTRASSRGHRPAEECGSARLAMLQERFAQMGLVASRFLDGLALFAALRQATRPASCWPCWLVIGVPIPAGGLLERGMRRRRPFPWRCRRTDPGELQARPKSGLEDLAEQARTHLGPVLEVLPVSPRPAAEYQQTLFRRASRQRWPRHPPSPARRRMPLRRTVTGFWPTWRQCWAFRFRPSDLDQFLAEAELEPMGPLEFVDRSPVGSAGRCASRTNHSTPHSCDASFPRGPGVGGLLIGSSTDRQMIRAAGRSRNWPREISFDRCDNLVLVGQKRRGKEFLLMASLGTARGLRVPGYRVRYITQR